MTVYANQIAYSSQKKSVFNESCPTFISYVFCIGVLCAPILKVLLETVMFLGTVIVYKIKAVDTGWKLILRQG